MDAISKSPDEVYGELFHAVQGSAIFKDSKTFVDAIPRRAPSAIVKDFAAHHLDPGFSLDHFVHQNFEIPQSHEEPSGRTSDHSLRAYIELLWDVLYREADPADDPSSLVQLPQPYIVPGGRFREIYYWDSYFTMLGLAASGRVELIRAMVDNFAYLIERLGFVPNGNRTYYCSRSQPPFFALMLRLLAGATDRQEILVDYLPALEREYRFWMAGEERLRNGTIVNRRVVRAGGGVANRYWDDVARPRPESYAEDLRLAGQDQNRGDELFRDVRAACESGWDFSSRWLDDGGDLTSIHTTQIVPVDLNAIMFGIESTLADASQLAGDASAEKHYSERAGTRKRLLRELFFDDDAGFFCDLLLPDLEPSPRLSLAGAFPLYFNVATPQQAERVAAQIHRSFLNPGGWVTTLTRSGQQWDAPNGWAPLQWIVYRGLKNYGFHEWARAGARRWMENNIQLFKRSSRLLEKYNVEEVGAHTGGGEYTLQHGFGWTNGVLLALMNELDGDQDARATDMDA